MLARVTTFTIDGLEPRRVTVEIDVRAGLPNFTIVGLADRAVREARERVRAAILNSGFEFPLKRVTVNLAPASMRKAGPGFDLAIACAILAVGGHIPPDALERYAVFGELGLGGEMRPCRGALAVAEGRRARGWPGLVLPRQRALEAALVDGLDVLGASSLAQVAEILRGGERPPPPDRDESVLALPARHLDLADVRGHTDVVEALTIAAAGAHNLLLSGPPGVGKTMLARRLPSILPPLSRAEAVEVTRIHSVAGQRRGGGLMAERPFRAPHHMISASGLVGGGAVPVPGRRASPTTACSSSTSCPSSRAPRSRRCASRWRTAAWPSCAASARRSSRRASCSWPPPTRARAGTRPRRAVAAAKATSRATPGA